MIKKYFFRFRVMKGKLKKNHMNMLKIGVFFRDRQIFFLIKDVWFKRIIFNKKK